MKESQKQLLEFEGQNAQKDKLRQELQQKLKTLREMEVNISQEQLKNENLKKVQKYENELRKKRDTQETELLSTASQT